MNTELKSHITAEEAAEVVRMSAPEMKSIDRIYKEITRKSKEGIRKITCNIKELDYNHIDNTIGPLLRKDGYKITLTKRAKPIHVAFAKLTVEW